MKHRLLLILIINSFSIPKEAFFIFCQLKSECWSLLKFFAVHFSFILKKHEIHIAQKNTLRISPQELTQSQNLFQTIMYITEYKDMNGIFYLFVLLLNFHRSLTRFIKTEQLISNSEFQNKFRSISQHSHNFSFYFSIPLVIFYCILSQKN